MVALEVGGAGGGGAGGGALEPAGAGGAGGGAVDGWEGREGGRRDEEVGFGRD